MSECHHTEGSGLGPCTSCELATLRAEVGQLREERDYERGRAMTADMNACVIYGNQLCKVEDELAALRETMATLRKCWEYSKQPAGPAYDASWFARMDRILTEEPKS